MQGFKIAISGKGGVGKSTVAAVWAQLLAKEGISVLAVDADPDSNLAHALGISPEFQKKIRPLALEKELIEERTGAKAGLSGQLFTLNPQVSDIISKYSVNFNGVNLLVLGAVKKGGGGCACPESALIKSFVRYAVLHDNEAVILDMEAGVEHLGRATAVGVDALVTVTEAGSRSFETAGRIRKLAADIGLDKKFMLLLNKVREGTNSEKLAKEMFPDVEITGKIPFDDRFIINDQLRRSILDDPDCDDLVNYFGDSLHKLIFAVKEKQKENR